MDYSRLFEWEPRCTVSQFTPPDGTGAWVEFSGTLPKTFKGRKRFIYGLLADPRIVHVWVRPSTAGGHFRLWIIPARWWTDRMGGPASVTVWEALK